MKLVQIHERWSYLAGYRAGAISLRNDIKRTGWARAKGAVKVRIAWYVTTMQRVFMKDPFSQGFVDAILDSVN